MNIDVDSDNVMSLSLGTEGCLLEHSSKRSWAAPVVGLMAFSDTAAVQGQCHCLEDRNCSQNHACWKTMYIVK